MSIYEEDIHSNFLRSFKLEIIVYSCHDYDGSLRDEDVLVTTGRRLKFFNFSVCSVNHVSIPNTAITIKLEPGAQLQRRLLRSKRHLFNNQNFLECS